ncbi:calcium homeostasis modulator protein 6-like isoform X1 [Capricornis sumatraensis]|uniref:calcium homeostasis modulator protein 6-like isoform X1 n=1 Tax=Capricornis sumatraensis TaxID=34865 RepID=UPI0036052555
MEKFREVLNLHLKYRNALGYCLVSLLTAGGERIFSSAVFQCPCSASWNLPYGLVFLLVPALALFLLGYVLSARTWRLLTGCCARGCGAGLRGALVCAQISATAAVAPLTWVAVALLGGAFYECAASGSEVLARYLCVGRDPRCVAQLPLVPCQQAQAPDVKQLHKELQRELTAHSQVLGWILIAVVIILLLIFTSISRCRSPVSYMQLKFWEIYLQQEQQIFKSQATEHATQLAQENVKCFFERSHPQEYNTPSIKDWQKISSLYTFNPKEQYYSTLHKYVNKKQKSQSSTASEEGAMVPVLGFVDSSDMNSTTDL